MEAEVYARPPEQRGGSQKVGDDPSIVKGRVPKIPSRGEPPGCEGTCRPSEGREKGGKHVRAPSIKGDGARKLQLQLTGLNVVGE